MRVLPTTDCRQFITVNLRINSCSLPYKTDDMIATVIDIFNLISASMDLRILIKQSAIELIQAHIALFESRLYLFLVVD